MLYITGQTRPVSWGTVTLVGNQTGVESLKPQDYKLWFLSAASTTKAGIKRIA